MGRYGSGSRADELERQRLHRERIDADPPRCKRADCGKLIPAPRRYRQNITYCSADCRAKEIRARDRLKRKLADAKALAGPDTLIFDELAPDAGPTLSLIDDTLSPAEVEAWVYRRMSDRKVAERIGKSAQVVGRARRAATNRIILREQARHHEVAAPLRELLGPSDLEMRRLLAEDPEQFEAMLDRLADAFVAWRGHFFRVWGGVAYFTRPVHRRWIKATLRAIYVGGRLMILSPPRHGKTELLIHFCVWLICRNPDIRILWVGPNEEIAENCVGQVKNLLADHEDLKTAYLAPGESWEPQARQGKLWRDKMFRVANRSFHQKQPTMWAAGVGGKILSLDADFIVVDDPADPDESQTDGGRTRILKWFRIKLITRKMRFSGLAMISSRNHYEDLYSNYIDASKWEVLVDKAHDFAVCGRKLFDDHADLSDPDACVLFPEMNPIDHLRDQHEDVGAPLFDMMFQNMPHPETSLIFDPDIIEDRCFDRSRVMGLPVGVGNYTLVAGLDPAPTNIQASFCWAFDFANDRDYMVDLETQEAGGVEGAVRIIRHWYQRYGVLIWVLEDGGWMKLYHDDPRLKALKVEIPGLQILPCSTGANKHDPFFGVSAMAFRYHAGKVVLPYGDQGSVRKVDRFVRQMTGFTGIPGVKTKRQSDILMASWFPTPDVKRRLRANHLGEVRGEVVADEEFSYLDYETSDWDEAGYEPTSYPYGG